MIAADLGGRGWVRCISREGVGFVVAGHSLTVCIDHSRANDPYSSCL
jgi:hypothetical protein